MSTVKYYKDLGLEFVYGDLGDSNGLELDDMHENQGGDKFIWAFGEDTVTEFAWRNNTGKAPSYRGDIEVGFRSGQLCIGHPVLHWELKGDRDDIIKWRPVLVKKESKLNAVEQVIAGVWSQPSTFKGQGMSVHYELTSSHPGRDAWPHTIGCPFTSDKLPSFKPVEKVEPVFTQEMKDNGELPPVGSEAILELNDPDGDYGRIYEFNGSVVTVMAVVPYLVGQCVMISNLEYGVCALNLTVDNFKPIDTRTDEEELIGEAAEAIFGNGAVALSDINIIASMIKAGYRKP